MARVIIKVKSPESGQAVHRELKAAGFTDSDSYLETLEGKSKWFISLDSLVSEKALLSFLETLPFQTSLV